MSPANLGAVRLPFLAAAVLASFAASLSAQVVEKGRTFADLTASHPCSSAYTDRIARVLDCDAADDVGDGGGAFQCWVTCDGSAPWTNQAIGAGGGGLPGAGEVTEAMLKAVDTANDEEVLTYETTTGDFEWQAAATGTIGGSTGATDNLICRADGVGGSTIQNSPLSLSDVSGVTTTLATITPAATTGATVAGQSMAITASPAVASTDTAGAAAGGSVTITAGAAARNASGNANGGDVTLTPGAGIGTGSRGKVNFGPNGAAISDSNADGRLDFWAGGARQADLVDIGGGYQLRYVGAQGITTPKITISGATTSGSLAIGSTSVGSYSETHSSEVLTLSTGGATTATSANLAPANSVIEAILYRITSTITTATAFEVKVTGGNSFANIGTGTTSQTTLTVGTTGVLVPVLHTDQYNASATTLTVTTTGTPGAGAIRLTVIYKAFTPATL